MALGTTQQELSRPIEPFYDYTNDISANIYISGQTAFCRGEVIGKSAVNKIEAEMTLQKKTLLWWSKVETWSKTEYSNLVEMEKSHSIDSGTYRVKVKATIHNGNAQETVDVYSAEKKK